MTMRSHRDPNPKRERAVRLRSQIVTSNPAGRGAEPGRSDVRQLNSMAQARCPMEPS